MDDTELLSQPFEEYTPVVRGRKRRTSDEDEDDKAKSDGSESGNEEVTKSARVPTVDPPQDDPRFKVPAPIEVTEKYAYDGNRKQEIAANVAYAQLYKKLEEGITAGTVKDISPTEKDSYRMPLSSRADPLRRWTMEIVVPLGDSSTESPLWPDDEPWTIYNALKDWKLKRCTEVRRYQSNDVNALLPEEPYLSAIKFYFPDIHITLSHVTGPVFHKPLIAAIRAVEDLCKNPEGGDSVGSFGVITLMNKEKVLNGSALHFCETYPQISSLELKKKLLKLAEEAHLLAQSLPLLLPKKPHL
jgi:hypothetical protein